MGEIFEMKGNDGSASDVFIRRVKGEITTREYLKSIEDRVAARRERQQNEQGDRDKEQPPGE